MSNPLVFEFELLPPGLNSRGGLMRTHWAQRRGLAQAWGHLVAAQAALLGLDPTRPVLRCRLVWGLALCRLMDWDNAAARFKLVGDALVKAHVLADDSPRVVVEFSVRQRRVAHRNEQGCRVEIYPEEI